MSTYGNITTKASTGGGTEIPAGTVVIWADYFNPKEGMTIKHKNGNPAGIKATIESKISYGIFVSRLGYYYNF